MFHILFHIRNGFIQHVILIPSFHFLITAPSKTNATTYIMPEGVFIYPDKEGESYGNRENRTFQLLSQPTQRIYVEIIRTEIEYQKDCLYDRLTISGLISQQTLCGSVDNERPLSFLSRRNSVTFSFTSDESVTGLGFAVRWRFINTSVCIDEVENESYVTFQSINYPSPYGDRVDCCQQLKGPSDYNDGSGRILISLRRFSLMTKSTCFSLHGRNNTLYSTCGNVSIDVPRHFMSEDGYITLCYNASALHAFEGFEGQYRYGEYITIYNERKRKRSDSVLWQIPLHPQKYK